MKLSTAHKIGRFFQYFVLILVGVIMIYPLVWMVGATFKGNAEIFSGIGFLTANPTLLFVKDGVVKDRSVGAVKPVELTAWVEKNL